MATYMNKKDLLTILTTTDEVFVNWLNVPQKQVKMVKGMLAKFNFTTEDAGCPQQTFTLAL